MNNSLPPGQDDKELAPLAQLVAENLQKGESPDVIAGQLIENGWESDDAHRFVASIAHRLENQQNSQNSEGSGWLIWIGIILLVNLGSYLFNWGFWIW